MALHVICLLSGRVTGTPVKFQIHYIILYKVCHWIGCGITSSDHEATTCGSKKKIQKKPWKLSSLEIQMLYILILLILWLGSTCVYRVKTVTEVLKMLAKAEGLRSALSRSFHLGVPQGSSK
jgi:hypothetical protein